jgi:hypothetical protein
MCKLTLQLLKTSVLVCFAASSMRATDAPFTGSFEGTGRACYGGLYIRTRTISWVTPFSRCERMPYQLLEHSENGTQQEFAFQFKRPAKSCRFSVLYLYHGNTANLGRDWHVIGYASLQDYEGDKRNGFKADNPASQSCWLVSR